MTSTKMKLAIFALLQSTTTPAMATPACPEGIQAFGPIPMHLEQTSMIEFDAKTHF